ncbi:ATP-grasp domain-containing protein [Candidatus Microgenomates bacterium]|nr:ATP-grasp domain-containing protein [Candidatus Microgenomates bacterium]
MDITVVYNRVADLPFGNPQDLLADNDTVIMAGKVAKALETLDHKISLLELDEETITTLPKVQTDCFFNLCGGINSLPHTESQAAKALEDTGKPVAGSSATAIALTTDKAATKKLLLANNLPTPKYWVAAKMPADLTGFSYPVIVKPVAEDCSLGISADSVFVNPDGLVKKITELHRLYDEPVLVEEYIDGRELRVSIVGNGPDRIVLPISELVFGQTFAHKFKIFDFSAKWLPGSTPYEDTEAVSPADLPDSVRTLVEQVSLAAFSLTGCADYGRVDIRLDKKGTPYILEINANPAIGPDDALATSAAAAGLSYPQLLERIVQAAL